VHTTTKADQPQAPPAARRPRGPRRGWALRLWQLGVLAALLGLWQLVSSLNLVDPVISKTPAQVFGYLRQAWDSGELQRNTWATMEAVLIAFVLASLTGIVLGIALGLMPGVERAINPFLDAANAMPRIALAPVFVVWLGIGMSAKIALAFSIVVFIVLTSARAGVRSADPEILRMSAVLGITKVQLFLKVLLPVSVPSIFAGLRLGLVYSLLGVVGSEIIASQNGLGQLIATYSGQFQLQAVYGILIVLAVIAALLNTIMATAEQRLLRWQPPHDS
jgi:NitT/TauT family transport system permease protein